MFRTLFACATALSFGALSPVLAQTASPPLKVVEAQASGGSAGSEKTSDRTPDNPRPQRTPGAGITGAVGTDVARTPYGTSDRTPSNHYIHPSN
jgi:hypothetical protein